MLEQDPQVESDTPVVAPPVSAELELATRRELAIQTTDAISEVLEVDVTLRSLENLATTTQVGDPNRLVAVRALRCVEAIARPNSVVVREIGQTSIYHYVEGVIQYGASERNFLFLMNKYGLSAEQVTCLYELREEIAEFSDGSRPGFPTMERAFASLGMSMQQAALDIESAVTTLDNAGYFINNKGKRTFDETIFAPKLAEGTGRLLPDDPDGSLTAGILDAQRTYLNRTADEIDDEGESLVAQSTAEVVHELLNGLGI